MYDDILLPTDGSEGAEVAIDHALELAERYGSTLHALYVVERIHTADVGTEQIIGAMRSEGKRAVAEIAERAEAKGVEAITEVRVGSPARDILKYADENGVDLVVMGTHGRTGLNRYLLGSVTEKVVRLSDVPVLTVRMNNGDEA